jgi:hypothetical protein
MSIETIFTTIVLPVVFVALTITFTILKLANGKNKVLALLWQAVQHSAEWLLENETEICKYVADLSYSWIPGFLKVFISSDKWLEIVKTLFTTVTNWATDNKELLIEYAEFKAAVKSAKVRNVPTPVSKPRIPTIMI